MGKNGDPALFARRVREERQRRGWRFEDLAAAVAKEGVTLHLSAYSKLESAGRPPRLREAVAIADALDVPLAALLAPDGEIGSRIEQLRAESVRLGAESDDALRRAVQYRNEAARLAGEMT
jgi:transcriptional regulator with XRE-family HTH domain